MKNYKLFSKLFYGVIFGVCALTLSPAIAADITTDNYVDDATAYYAPGPCSLSSNSPSCLAAGYGYNYRNLLFRETYNQDYTMMAGSILHSILIPPPALSLSYQSKTSQSILNLISNQGNVADNLLRSTPEIFAPGIVLALSLGPGISVPANLPSFVSSLLYSSNGPTEAQQQSAINTLSLDSLIAPIVYHQVKLGDGKGNNDAANTVDQPLIADTFIQYVTGLANPMRAADFTAMKIPTGYTNRNAYLYDLQKKPEVRDYLTALRNYTAQLSVGISNLYYIYNERMPITDPAILAKATQLTTPPKGSALPPLPQGLVSPLAVEQFLATRRVSDTTWYTSMQNAMPSTLLRETLYLLAEIPPMLFQLHLDLERILATMSAMQIQQAGGNRLLLEQQRDKVDKILQNPEQAQSEAAQATEQAEANLNQEQMKQAQEALKNND